MTRDQAADQDDPLRHVYLRLYELARHGARRVHDWYFDAAENIDEIPSAGHVQPFDFCPHADCALAREAPSDLYVRAFRQGYQHRQEEEQGDCCIACGEVGQGGYLVEDGPGPFCAECWQRLEDEFKKPDAGSTAATDQG